MISKMGSSPPTFVSQSRLLYHLAYMAVETGWGWKTRSNPLPVRMSLSLTLLRNLESILSCWRAKTRLSADNTWWSCSALPLQPRVEAPAWRRLIKWRFTRGRSEEQSLTLQLNPSASVRYTLAQRFTTSSVWLPPSLSLIKWRTLRITNININTTWEEEHFKIEQTCCLRH